MNRTMYVFFAAERIIKTGGTHERITLKRVEGAVEIVKDAVERVQAAGFELAENHRDVLVSNLLVVLCSGDRAQPVLQVQAGQAT